MKIAERENAIMKNSIKLAIALLLGLSAPAIAQDIKVGTIFPLSGGAGPDGQSVTNAVKLAIEQINDAGGLLGRKIALVSKDDESTPAVGVSRANEMIAEKVALVIEGWNSPVTLAMQPILARAGILDITAVSKSDLILSGETNPLAIRINSSNGFDAVIVTNSSNSSGLPAMVEQYRQADLKSAFVGAVGIMLPTVFKVAGDANHGIVSADIYFWNLLPFSAIPESTSFVAAFKKAYGVEPDKSAALGAAALQVWARAVEATKSLDRKTVAEAIRGKTIKGTVFGDATFLPNGQLQPRYV